jgi:hypothetical protein
MSEVKRCSVCGAIASNLFREAYSMDIVCGACLGNLQWEIVQRRASWDVPGHTIWGDKPIESIDWSERGCW